MKTKQISLFLFFFMVGIFVFGQNYPNIVNYNFNATPTYGVKIKTNLPFQNSSQMPTIKIEGYNYQHSTINLTIAWYIYDNVFYSPTASSFGGSAPNVWLSNENGKVVIFLDQKIYFQRFTVSAFAQGTGEKPEYFQGWTVVDAALSGTNQKQVPYKNVFAGNVGIGTETPEYKLDVNGDIRSKNIVLPSECQISRSLSDNFTYQGRSVGQYSFGWVPDSWLSGGGTLWQSGYAGIKFFTQGQPRMSINFSGNVGIGTDNPKNKLEVAGTIRATEVKIEALPWADFVFDKDYKLLSLEEVKAHIEEHKHLPDVPSEKQVIEEGINIGEMQAKLLQKIEELTLYVIQQDIKNKELTLSVIQQGIKNKELEQEIKELKVSLSKE